MANPQLAVTISIPTIEFDKNQELLDLLISAKLISYHCGVVNDKGEVVTEVTIFPPKHVVRYNVWADDIVHYCASKGWRSNVVRPLTSPTYKTRIVR
jgi:hypothetical protein